MGCLLPGGVTEVGSLSWEPSLAVGQEGPERAEVVWEGWRRRWLGKGSPLASPTRLIWGYQHVVRACARCVCCVSQVGV